MQLVKKAYKTADGTRKKCRVWTARWWIRGKCYEKSLGTRDKQVAQQIAADLIRKSELRAAGLLDPFEQHRERLIEDHVQDFEVTLRGRGVTAQYVHDRMHCLRECLAATDVRRIADLDLANTSRWLLSLRDPPRSLAARGVNGFVRAILQFAIWLVRTRRAPWNPLEGLSTLNEEEDRRRVRRALTPEEAARLIEAARTRPLDEATAQRVRAGVRPKERLRLLALGEARALLYTLALGTGLRRGELQRLRWADLDLERGLVTVTAASAKSRVEQAVELHPCLVEALRAARPAVPDPAAPVIPSSVFPTMRSFHADLVDAGLAREVRIPLDRPTKSGVTFKRRWDTRDATGRIVDFHALRTTFITWLSMTGAHPRTAQALARHSSLDLTMRVYTDVRRLDLRAAVERLPLPGVRPAAPTAIQGNGTT
jgi:integrase/recombinase XerD